MKTKKRLYVGLLLGSFLLGLVLIAIIWLLFTKRTMLSQVLVQVILACLAISILVLGAGILAIIMMIVRSKSTPSLDNISKRVNEMLFPLTIVIGRFFGIEQEKVQRSYIEVNNNLVKSKKLVLPGDQIMILLPHCLQDADCPHKITVDINNCKQCGKCCIGDLINLSRKYNAVIKVATGGTLARKFIEDHHPAGIIAIACERDLSLGILETASLPVYGVLNCRPNGPCYNTSVDMSKVEMALQAICKEAN
ncbi:Protein of unknown function DUF116 [Syntrophomonas zehnderi OL-4]|uniref:DUF116 domain-containing protein n=1 Tax=Syntrophomonas zehnderi OL-4 TaxID=690567 RepID=A0A0E4C8Y5_9FIRM|nr:DUF116 domain-containing protein [Syntrophomonas zehnderi]CFX77268.1 Protein of unknown function DUF116 [Syntrophomonas zehnderi OL-4]